MHKWLCGQAFFPPDESFSIPPCPAQHSCNVQAVACINDACADLLVFQSCDEPHITLACRVILTIMSFVVQFQFHERIAQLVYTFPEDATTSTGALFWSAPKRFPQPLTFNPADPSHVAFAQAGAILKAQVHNITIPAWGSDLDKVPFSKSLCP